MKNKNYVIPVTNIQVVFDALTGVMSISVPYNNTETKETQPRVSARKLYV